ncbi:alpha/beta hydrolase [Cupriavidus lacunae]|uniref:Alpha/beta hydrolase n=1 Tax=Cupriavidus lacunae TaxID=2666307 RepID=A0A370NJT0_9BURK|nr:alpha/beta hydrolase [Cupriavidus lacunae]RDK05859.1 alpha/beta hydrolase [Cupriavidus lacunae]
MSDSKISDAREAVSQVVDRVQRVYSGWRRDTTVEKMRADWDALFQTAVAAKTETVDIGSCQAEWIVSPGADNGPVLLYLHGGGFRLGSCQSHRELMAGLSTESGVRVLGLDYRLLPEHPFPAQQEDAFDAWCWLLGQGFSPRNLAIAGDSAGAWIALRLLCALRDAGHALPAAAVTMSALTDLSASGPAYLTRADADPIHQRQMIAAIGRAVVGPSDDPQDPRFSPLFADLQGLPPLLMQVGDREVVLSDTTEFAVKARAAGVEVEDQVWPEMIHVFQQFPELEEARQARQTIGRFLRHHFNLD